MKYYKVKPESDQQQVMTKSPFSGKWRIKGYLIANELITENELLRKFGLSKSAQPNFIQNHFEEVDIKPKRTYFFFGSRRESILKTN